MALGWADAIHSRTVWQAQHFDLHRRIRLLILDRREGGGDLQVGHAKRKSKGMEQGLASTTDNASSKDQDWKAQNRNMKRHRVQGIATRTAWNECDNHHGYCLMGSATHHGLLWLSHLLTSQKTERWQIEGL